MREHSNYQKVREFHQAMGSALDMPMVPSEVTNRLLSLRLELIDEEYTEVKTAVTVENLLKECVDLIYVLYGFGATFGYDMDEAFDIVHASNMSKLGADGKPVLREDGKVMKGPNYKPADLRGIVG